MKKYVTGQRWASEMEPELGLGTVTGITKNTVTIHFYGSSGERRYALSAAPLVRICYSPGDTLKTRSGDSFLVESVEEVCGLYRYHGHGKVLTEQDLSDFMSFSSPRDRLCAGMSDSNAMFDLRLRALMAKSRAAASPVQGFLGGRVDLVPHQFYIAGEVTSRHIPRVLLSDETGLGKTIEACLILHRLLLSERIGRVLILVPESLVHQWFVELYRRFSLVFRIFDREHCASLESSEPGCNPFAEDQLGICSMDFFLENMDVQLQLEQAGWDMLVVDEAHHLDLSGEKGLGVTSLCGKIPGLMLLTATPEQLGAEAHFEHLRLLDPSRYHSFQAFNKDALAYRDVAEKIDRIMAVGNAGEEVFNWEESSEISDLLDRHGPGRVMFRNTRSVIKGFPEREGMLYGLSGDGKQVNAANLEVLKGPEKGFFGTIEDPRIPWLVALLEKYRDSKILLITASVQRAEAIKRALEKHVQIKMALFHENFTMVQRDRNAAWFSQDSGARLLICSEIGSEGRNFQFVNHLVMFDLPELPELLEQRIGRLDRIGQKNRISIHVPYICGSAQEILARWYHDGTGMFARNISGVHGIHSRFRGPLRSIIESCESCSGFSEEEFQGLLKETRAFSKEFAGVLAAGRDRLLEMNSFRPEKADDLIFDIEKADANRDIDRLMVALFEHYGISVDETGTRTFRLTFGDGVDESFPVPALGSGGMEITFSRAIAVSREEVAFLTWDHPMVTGTIDLFLGSGPGNCVVAGMEGDPGLVLETVYVLECVAPGHLNAGRFLPGTPVRVAVDHSFSEVSEDMPALQRGGKDSSGVRDIGGAWLRDTPEILKGLLPGMLDKTMAVSEKRAEEMINKSRRKMNDLLGSEISRLKELKKVNPSVRGEEIAAAGEERAQLDRYLASSRLRLDSLRLIRKS